MAGDDSKQAKSTTYRAPALEKGLEILTFLAQQEDPLTLTAIVQQMGKSSGELFRLLQVLQTHGFVAQSREGYVLTPKLLQIGMERPPLRNLVEVALPAMRRLANDTEQSCHLGLISGSEMVVIARMESRQRLGFSVRLGYRQPLHLTGSGMVLYAFQPPAIQAEWEASFSPRLSGSGLADFRRRASEVHAAGHAALPSAFTNGITDLSAPVMRGDRAAAALTIPFVEMRTQSVSMAAAATRLVEAAQAISESLTGSDSRV
ncbi:IclR family transcriptional regulator [Sphingomonas spermidinifaciens]|uniref:IclR family transcriptional regulator n=1 Tax=Sphingomonas spermidinifaciens TaxID=1141889 RepID=UPI001FE84689|nr:IclR family transcriptional regulator [Sphingomonas spermidinifaciens]